MTSNDIPKVRVRRAIAMVAAASFGCVGSEPSTSEVTINSLPPIAAPGHSAPRPPVAFHETITRAFPEDPASDLVVWARRHDDIDVLDAPRSVRVQGGRWELRQHRELVAPEPARSADILPAAVAATRAGLPPSAHARRLVYVPRFVEQPLRTPVENAADVENVIAGYRLAHEIVDTEGGAIVWADAYSGEVVGRRSLARHVAPTVTVSGRFYPQVILNATPTSTAGVFSLADPVRASQLDASGHLYNGQGVVRGVPTSEVPALRYWTTDLADSALEDAAFSLQQAWDFFHIAFGRTGLRDLPRGTSSVGNDGILDVDSRKSSLNVAMNFDPNTGRATGLISVYSGHASWRSLLNLEILGHEWTHGVFDADVLPDLFLDVGEQAGLEEGTADFFGMLVGTRGRAVLAAQSCHGALCDPSVPGIVPIANTMVGWFTGDDDPTTPAGFGHYLCKPSRNPPSAFHDPFIDEWRSGVMGLDGHVVSGAINRLHCLLARGVVATAAVGDADLKSSWVPRGFPGIGTEATARIWYQTLTFLHHYPSPITFLNARFAALDAATALYGTDSEPYKGVQDAFAAIAVGSMADRDPPQVSLPWKLIQPDTPAPIIVTDDAGVASLVVSLDGVPLATLTAPPWQVTISSLVTEGAHTLSVLATDIHLNAQAYDFTVVRDTTPPNETFTDMSYTEAGGSRGYVRKFDFKLDDIGGLASARVLLNGALAHQYSLPLSWTYPADTTTASETGHYVNLGDNPAGTYVLSLEATDVSGHVGTVTLPPFVREYDLPTRCNLSLDVDPGDWSKVKMTVTANDAGSHIRSVIYMVDGAGWTADTEIAQHYPLDWWNWHTTPSLTAGTHSFQLQCYDAQGNMLASPVQSLILVPPCNTTVVAGGNIPSTQMFNMGAASGTVSLVFQTFGVHDRMRVFTASNQLVLDTGCVATGPDSVFVTRTFSYAGTPTLTVAVEPNCNPDTAASSTLWNYRLTCP